MFDATDGSACDADPTCYCRRIAPALPTHCRYNTGTVGVTSHPADVTSDCARLADKAARHTPSACDWRPM